TDRTGEASFLSGVLLQLVNPKNLIFGLTAMTSYILPYYQAPAALLGFALLLATASASATVCWSLFGTALYRLFANHGRAINTVMALLLVYCAVSLFL
ncbi:MAG: lysine transporter LysE, partial [Clostridiales bacterium]|nr:lysine transporter LysE [Clostridiales bacterium]